MTSGIPGGIAGFSRDPDEIERSIQQWAQGFAAKAERYKAAQEKTEQIRLTATSPDGAVRVTVGADGNVTDLEFTKKIQSMPLPELAARILSTMRTAQADITKRVAEVMTEQLGDEDAQTRSVMLDNLRQRFPEQPDELETDEPVAEKWDYRDEEPATPPPPPAPAPPAPMPPPPPAATRPPEPKRPRRRPNEDDDDIVDPLRD